MTRSGKSRTPLAAALGLLCLAACTGLKSGNDQNADDKAFDRDGGDAKAGQSSQSNSDSDESDAAASGGAGKVSSSRAGRGGQDAPDDGEGQPNDGGNAPHSDGGDPSDDGEDPPDGGEDPPEDAGPGEAGQGGTSANAGTGGTDPGDQCVPTGEREFEHVTDTSTPHIEFPQDNSLYNSDPPSTGLHCDAWGVWETVYPESSPLSPCNYLHNLEHGAVMLLYNCPEGCDDVVEMLVSILEQAEDPDCAGEGVTRVLVSPYTEMDAMVAAVAWGYTWTSDCVDDDAHDEIAAFVSAHLGSTVDDPAPEAGYCAPGSVDF